MKELIIRGTGTEPEPATPAPESFATDRPAGAQETSHARVA
jgi:hypothetical protein